MKDTNIYITVIGAWGDALAALGNASLLKQANIEAYKIIYFGYDPYIKIFLEMQPNTVEVIHVLPKNEKHYEEVCLMSCCTENITWKDWMPLLDIEIDSDGIVFQTHVTSFLQRENPNFCIRNFECDLPGVVLELEEKVFNNQLLFQPYSIQSSTFQEHWSHWLKALDWILSDTDWEVTIVGTNSRRPCQDGAEFEFPGLPSHPRLNNMVGKTESMIEVFSLADSSDYIITTNNCLSMWSIIRNKPALVVHTARSYPYFKNWISAGLNTVLSNETTLDEFKKEFLAMDYELRKPLQILEVCD